MGRIPPPPPMFTSGVRAAIEQLYLNPSTGEARVVHVWPGNVPEPPDGFELVSETHRADNGTTYKRLTGSWAETGTPSTGAPIQLGWKCPDCAAPAEGERCAYCGNARRG